VKLPKKAKKEHEHKAHGWDGYYERCRCGAFAGDKINANGRRCITFEEWKK
jgi:hypothetical protein